MGSEERIWLLLCLPSILMEGSRGSRLLHGALFHRADKSYCSRGYSLVLCICKDIPRAISLKMHISLCIKTKVLTSALGFALKILRDTTCFNWGTVLKANCFLFSLNQLLTQVELQKEHILSALLRPVHHEHMIEMQIDSYEGLWFVHYLLITFPFRIGNDYTPFACRQPRQTDLGLF